MKSKSYFWNKHYRQEITISKWDLIKLFFTSNNHQVFMDDYMCVNVFYSNGNLRINIPMNAPFEQFKKIS